MVNGNQAVSITIKSETYIKLFLKDFLLQKRRIDCTALRIDIEPIRRCMPDAHCGAKLPKQRRRYSRCCTIRTVQADTKIDRCFIVPGLSEKISVMLYTTLREGQTSNSVPCQMLFRTCNLYLSFNCLLKHILEFSPCGGEKLNPIIHVRIVRRGDHSPSRSASMAY